MSYKQGLTKQARHHKFAAELQKWGYIRRVDRHGHSGTIAEAEGGDCSTLNDSRCMENYVIDPDKRESERERDIEREDIRYIPIETMMLLILLGQLSAW